MMDLQENLQQVEANICKACENAGRKRLLKVLDLPYGKFRVDVGLDYLALSRATGTLSGGEAQRISMIWGCVILERIKFRKCVRKWKFFLRISAGI